MGLLVVLEAQDRGRDSGGDSGGNWLGQPSGELPLCDLVEGNGFGTGGKFCQAPKGSGR